MKKNYFMFLLVTILIFITGCAKKPATEQLIDSAGLPYIAVYRTIPLWLNIWFVLAVLLFLLVLGVSGYLYFRISLRNRTNVIIHMPDKTRRLYSYKKFTGQVFKIKSNEKDKDGNDMFYNYQFRNEALEQGYFGRYIEYDYGMLEPLDSKQRNYNVKNIKEIFKFVSALLETQLAVDLLLSQKFKEFVIMMLYIIAVLSLLSFLVSAYNTYVLSQGKVVSCVLSNSSVNIDIIRSALRS